jgi:hypothetical protein
VEQRGGRFLARDKQSGGVWTIVAYKRAVDKTSQAFRERDREDDQGRRPLVAHKRAVDRTSMAPRARDREEGQSRETFNYEKDASAAPDSFSGLPVNPNLIDLTEGAGPPGRAGELCNADEQEHQISLSSGGAVDIYKYTKISLETPTRPWGATD